MLSRSAPAPAPAHHRRRSEQHAGCNAGSIRPRRPRLRPCQGLFDTLLGGITKRDEPLPLQSCEPELSAWLQANGVAPDALEVVPQQIEGEGRGLVAATNIAARQVVFSIPERLVLFPAVAAAASVLAPLLPQGTAALEDWTLLVLFLAEQRYYLARGLPPASAQWAPYLRSLPQGPVGTVLDWPRQQVASLLAGSGLRRKADTIITAADAVWDDVHALAAAAKRDGLCPADMFARADFDWAVSICLSRTVRLDDRGGVVVLLPFGDLANHSPDCSSFLEWSEQRRAVVLVADRAYRAREQVRLSYGFKSSGELLLSYGFCPPPGSSPACDAAFLTFGLDSKDPLLRAKQQALEARGLPPAETFGVRIDALPQGLLQYAAFCARWQDPPACAAADDVECLARQLLDELRLPADVGGASAELLALRAVAAEAKAALKAYPQSAAADRQLADTLALGGGGGGDGGGDAEQQQQWRLLAAQMAAVRVRERQILSRTEFVAAQRIKQLSGPGAGGRQRR